MLDKAVIKNNHNKMQIFIPMTTMNDFNLCKLCLKHVTLSAAGEVKSYSLTFDCVNIISEACRLKPALTF